MTPTLPTPLKEEMDVIAREYVYDLRKAVKFQLPFMGKFFEDHEFRGLDGVGEIRLPYPLLAFEYSATDQVEEPGQFASTKRVILAAEYTDPVNDERHIGLGVFSYMDKIKRWFALPPVDIDLNPKEVIEKGSAYYKFNGSKLVHYMMSKGCQPSDWATEIEVLMNFLNASTCRNVHVDVHRANVKGKAAKSPYPFDDYHYLTVDAPGTTSAPRESLGGSHRSPREHLRRGHIRRLEAGPVWVNATVVNPGVGGVIKKNYKVRMGM